MAERLAPIISYVACVTENSTSRWGNLYFKVTLLEDDEKTELVYCFGVPLKKFFKEREESMKPVKITNYVIKNGTPFIYANTSVIALTKCSFHYKKLNLDDTLLSLNEVSSIDYGQTRNICGLVTKIAEPELVGKGGNAKLKRDCLIFDRTCTKS